MKAQLRHSFCTKAALTDASGLEFNKIIQQRQVLYPYPRPIYYNF